MLHMAAACSSSGSVAIMLSTFGFVDDVMNCTQWPGRSAAQKGRMFKVTQQGAAAWGGRLLSTIALF